jgi:hypothetical protein
VRAAEHGDELVRQLERRGLEANVSAGRIREEESKVDVNDVA